MSYANLRALADSRQAELRGEARLRHRAARVSGRPSALAKFRGRLGLALVELGLHLIVRADRRAAR